MRGPPVGPPPIGIGIGIGIGPRLPPPIIYDPYPIYPYYRRIPVIESVEVLPTQVTETGMRITDLYEGAARQAALREGDIIVLVGEARVRNFDDLVAALARANGPVDVTYIAGGNNKLEKTTLTPVEGKIGVGVIPVSIR